MGELIASYMGVDICPDCGTKQEIWKVSEEMGPGTTTKIAPPACRNCWSNWAEIWDEVKAAIDAADPDAE